MDVLTEVVKHLETAPSTPTHWPVRRARLQSGSTRASARARDRRDSAPKLRRQRGASGALIETSPPAEGRDRPKRAPGYAEARYPIAREGVDPTRRTRSSARRASIPSVTELSPLRAGDVSVPLIDLDAASWREAVDPVTAPVERKAFARSGDCRCEVAVATGGFLPRRSGPGSVVNG